MVCVIIALQVFLSLNKHSHGPKFNYHSELWADRAGYFVYLPAAFAYGFDAARVEPGLDTKTGGGFRLDSESGVIVTKYPCGVSLLQSPFYVMGRLLRKATATPYQPFDLIDHAVPDVAAAFYGTVGLLCLYMLLLRRQGMLISVLTVLLIYGASNVLYYAIADPGMSHIYSFFLFSTLLWLLDTQHGSSFKRTWYRYALIGTCTGLILLVRPTGVVFLGVVVSLFWRPIVSLPDLRIRRWVAVMAIAVPVLALCSLQTCYWLYAYESPLPWTYSGEGFTRWRSPELLRFLLAPHNGLLPYSPVMLLIAGGLFLGLGDGQRGESLVIGLALGVVVYLGSSWWVWHFGCGFGSRTFVEYTVLGVRCLPRVLVLFQARFGRSMLIAFACFLVGYTTKLVYSYGDCWFCEDWDWGCFSELVLGPTK